MKLFERIFGQTLSPAWEFSPGATIWKLLVTGNGILVGESRDVTKKEMTLFAVRLADGAPIFRGLTLGDPWWIALETVIDDIALLHLFPRPDMPSPLGVTAVDCATGEILWRNETIKVICGAREIALVQHGESFDPPDLLLIDARTGETIEEFGDDTERAREFQAACDDPAIWDDWTSSSPLSEEHPEAERLMRVLAGVARDQRGTVEIAEHGRYTVASVHQRSRRSADSMLASLVDNVLVVLDGDRIVFRDTIAKDVPAPSEDAFFIRRGTLIFIRDGGTLVAIDLDDD